LYGDVGGRREVSARRRVRAYAQLTRVPSGLTGGTDSNLGPGHVRPHERTPTGRSEVIRHLQDAVSRDPALRGPHRAPEPRDLGAPVPCLDLLDPALEDRRVTPAEARIPGRRRRRWRLYRVEATSS
jgi:hypothetical protein